MKSYPFTAKRFFLDKGRLLLAGALLFTAGCDNEVGITELTISELSFRQYLARGQTNPRGGVSLVFEGPSGRPCDVLSPDIRVTVDEVTIDERRYLGGYNGKGGHCNTDASFTAANIPPSDAPSSEVRLEDDSGAVVMQVQGLRNKREATFIAPADGQIQAGQTVLIDLNRPEDTYEFVGVWLMNEDLSGYALSEEATSYNAGTLSFTISETHYPMGISVPFNVVVHGEALLDVETCGAAKCTAVSVFQIVLPASYTP
jgi:hypothetical protein